MVKNEKPKTEDSEVENVLLQEKLWLWMRSLCLRFFRSCSRYFSINNRCEWLRSFSF